MGDITRNFSYYEFRPKGRPKTWKPSNEWRKLLIKNLAKNLQVVRSAMKKGCWMILTSAVRSDADYTRLIKLGYKPSKTSDHNTGLAIRLAAGSRKFKKYGETYNFSVGAGDVVSKGMSVYDLFKLAVKLNKAGKCDFGQIIYEYRPATKKRRKAEWVHFGGSINSLFSPMVVKFLARTKYMKSLDGGKTYSVVKNP